MEWAPCVERVWVGGALCGDGVRGAKGDAGDGHGAVLIGETKSNVQRVGSEGSD